MHISPVPVHKVSLLRSLPYCYWLHGVRAWLGTMMSCFAHREGLILGDRVAALDTLWHASAQNMGGLPTKDNKSCEHLMHSLEACGRKPHILHELVQRKSTWAPIKALSQAWIATCLPADLTRLHACNQSQQVMVVSMLAHSWKLCHKHDELDHTK